MSKAIPAIPRELIGYLAEVFPNKLPEEVLSEARMGELIGQQNVLRHLQAKCSEQARCDRTPTVL
jgi:hypothetical protein